MRRAPKRSAVCCKKDTRNRKRKNSSIPWISERIAFVKHYFDADWPTRSLYHVMINTAVGNEAVIQTILHTMHLVEGRPKATDYEPPKVHTSI